MENKLPICLAFVTDRNFFNYTMVTLYSILDNTDQPIKAYILTTNVDNSLKDACLQKFGNKNVEIIFKEFNAERFKRYSINNTKLTLTTYAKFEIPNLIIEENVLYVDSDIIVIANVNRLWNLFDPAYSIMAVPNPPFPRWKDSVAIGLSDGQKSFNAGVLFLNLKKIRQEHSEELLFKFTDANHNVVKMHDESAFNYVYKNDWKELPYYYNCTTLFFRRHYKIVGLSALEHRELTKNLSVIHFTGRDKPWSFISPHPLNALWRKYTRLALGSFKYTDISFKNLVRKIARKSKYYLSFYIKI